MAIITISRGSFSGGKAVAQRLSHRLGQPVLSREQVLAQAAKEYGIKETELVQVLNESPPFWQQGHGKCLAYVKCVTAVMLDHASQGNLLYHGNVGHLLLAQISHVLRIRIIADMEYRIRAAMKHAGLTKEKAIAYIRRVDEERSRWARLLYGVEWEDPVHYHAVLNLSRLSVDSASESIAHMTELKEFKPTKESQKRFDDLQLSCRVWGALAKHPQTRGAGIQVTADDGEVVIRGSVGSASALDLIPRLAKEVAGVKKVHCEAGMGTDWYW